MPNPFEKTGLHEPFETEVCTAEITARDLIPSDATTYDSITWENPDRILILWDFPDNHVR